MSYVDCDLKPNYMYAYKILSYNSVGYAESSFSRSIIIGQGKPSGFNTSIQAVQYNETMVEIYWSRPLFPNGQIVAYNIFRDSSLLTNASDILNSAYSDNFTYRDNYDFVPNKVYIYIIYVCNELGCSTDLERYSFNLAINDIPPLEVKKPKLIELNIQNAVLSAEESIVLKSPKTQNIVEYRFFLNNSLINRGEDPELYLSNLVPFTVYVVDLEACTFVTLTRNGCLSSLDQLIFQTNQSTPDSLAQIEFKDSVFNEFFLSVELKWSLPARPNGILRLVKLKRDDSVEILSSADMSVVSFIDKGLKYGQNYSYELVYFNDLGSVSMRNSHLTEENLPNSIGNIRCVSRTSTDIDIEVPEPAFPNGLLKKFELKFKKTAEQKWSILPDAGLEANDSSVHLLKISQLAPYTPYEFQAVFCNNKGCIRSNVTNDKNCATLDGAPIGIIPPDCLEISNENSEKIVILVKWKPPLQPNGVILGYTLYRVTIQTSISYDSSYNPVESQLVDGLKKELYSGMNLSYVDFNVGAFSSYDYFITVKTSFGSAISPYTRYVSRATAPLFLKVGELVAVTNQSALVNFKPPLYLNGRLTSVFIIFMSKNLFKEQEIYPNVNLLANLNLNGRDLLKYLSNFKLDHLQPNTKYELKTKFCNHVDCLTSFESIKFRTLDNNRFVFFNADAINNDKRIQLKWKFNFGNINETKFVK